jgi:hypothetical protein
MKRILGSLLGCVVAVLTAKIVEAQPMIRDSRPPSITAESESWYLSGTPITYEGHFYYPAGARVHFLPSEMVRSGDFRGVPLYARTTIEPFSIVFVPVGGGMMQPYERRREGELAGTVGSSAPSFPVALASDSGLDDVAFGPQAPAPPRLAELAEGTQETPPTPVGTYGDGRELDGLNLSLGERAARAGRFPRRADSPNAIFVEYSGSRWYSSGPPVPYEPARFTAAGQMDGFPVYRQRGGDPLTIYVPIAKDATSVAPYGRH